MLKKYLFLFLVTVFIVAGITNSHARLSGGVVTHNHSSGNTGGSSVNAGTLNVTGTADFDSHVTSSKPCVSGYYRSSPTTCSRDANTGTGAVLLDANVCSNLTIASGSKKQTFWVQFVVHSSGAVGGRQLDLDFFNTTNCTGAAQRISFGLYEFSAVAAGTTIGKHNSFFEVKTPDSGLVSVKYSGTASGFVDVHRHEYWDVGL